MSGVKYNFLNSPNITEFESSLNIAVDLINKGYDWLKNQSILNYYVTNCHKILENLISQITTKEEYQQISNISGLSFNFTYEEFCENCDKSAILFNSNKIKYSYTERNRVLLNSKKNIKYKRNNISQDVKNEVINMHKNDISSKIISSKTKIPVRRVNDIVQKY